MFCPWIYTHVPFISPFHRQGLSGRQISPLPLCLCCLAFPIFLPKGHREHISHISRLFFSLACLHLTALVQFFTHQKQNCSTTCTHSHITLGVPLFSCSSDFCFPPYHTSGWYEVVWSLPPAGRRVFQRFHLKVRKCDHRVHKVMVSERFSLVG